MTLQRQRSWLAALLAAVICLASLWSLPVAGEWETTDGFYGDINGDHAVNAADALLALQYSVKLITLSTEQLTAADVNGDGSVNASDALLILQMSVKLITDFPVNSQTTDPSSAGSDPSDPSSGTSKPTGSDASNTPSDPSTASTPSDTTSTPSDPSTASTPSDTTSTPSDPSTASTPSDTTSTPSDPSTASTPSETSTVSAPTLPENPQIADFGYTAVDPEDYYCYNQLNDKQKIIYNAMDTNAKAMKIGSFSAGVDNITEIDLRLSFVAYTHDHPESFWLAHSYSYSPANKPTKIYFSDANDENKTVDYWCTAAERSEMESQIQQKVLQAFRESLVPGLSMEERALRLHDWLAAHCEYDYEAARSTVITGYEASYTVYGALVNGLAVCEGYSRAYEMLCYTAGIPCTVITGLGKGGAHMWNAIELDGHWYLDDVTWDSGDTVTHFYCNQMQPAFDLTHQSYPLYTSLTEAQMKSIQSGFSFPLPVADTADLEYHTLHGIHTSNAQKGELPTQLAALVNQGNDAIEILVDDMVFETSAQVSEWLGTTISDMIRHTDPSRRPSRYAYSISPGSCHIKLTFTF